MGESIMLWFQPGSRREGLRWVSTHNKRLVKLCQDRNCRLCNLALREKLRGFRGGKLEVLLTLHRTPSFWEENLFYLGHLVSVPEIEKPSIDEGIEFDISKSNTVLAVTPRGAILIDPGSMGFDEQSPLRQIIGEKRIAATIVSHGHLDHWKDLGEIRNHVFMTRLAFQLASRHAFLQNDFAMARVLREAKMAIPGQPILLEGLGISIETFPLSHSIPEAMGLVLSGKKGRMVYLGDFRLSGWVPEIKAEMIARLKEIAQEKIDVVVLSITNCHIEGFTPMESLVIDTITDILVRANKRVIITCFSSNLERIRRIIEMARILGREVAFSGSGMENSAELLGIEGNEWLIGFEKAVVFATGCQGEEYSALWRIAQEVNPPFELQPDDTLVFSSRCIPGNEEVLKQHIAALRHKVGRLILNNGEVSLLGLGNLEIEEGLTHITGHASKEDIRLVLEILRPRQVLPLPQQSPQIETFCEIAEFLGIKVLPETERVIEI